MKKYLSWGLLVLLSLVFLSACGTEDTGAEKVSGDGDSSEETTEPKEEEKEEAPAEDKVFAVGDEVQLGDITVKIESASFTDPAEYSESQNGKVITMDVSVKNQGDETVFVDGTEFSMSTAEGNMVDDYYGYDELELSGEIRSEKQMQGKLYFDVPESDTYELVYEPTFSWSGDEIVWDIPSADLQ